MKRLFLAAALAVLIHGFVLSLGLEPAARKRWAPPRTEIITLTFHQRDKAALDLLPSSEVDPTPTKSTVATTLLDHTPGRTVVKKKSRIVHDGSVRTPASSAEPIKTVTPESRALTTVPGTQEELSVREGLGQTEDGAAVTGMEELGEGGYRGAQASAGAGSGHATGESPAYPFSASIREAIPVYRTNPPPEYPPIARRRGYEGIVLVEVLVSREGRVQELRLLQSSGYSVLDQAAIASVRKWLFEPATENEVKVEMWVKVPVRFQLK